MGAALCYSPQKNEILDKIRKILTTDPLQIISDWSRFCKKEDLVSTAVLFSVLNAMAQYIFSYDHREFLTFIERYGYVIGQGDVYDFVPNLIRSRLLVKKPQLNVLIIGFGGPMYLRKIKGVRMLITDLWPEYYYVLERSKAGPHEVSIYRRPYYLFDAGQNNYLISHADVVVITASAVTSNTIDELLMNASRRPLVWIYGRSSNPFLFLTLRARDVSIVSWSHYTDIEKILKDLEWEYPHMFEEYMDMRGYVVHRYVYKDWRKEEQAA